MGLWRSRLGEGGAGWREEVGGCIEGPSSAHHSEASGLCDLTTHQSHFCCSWEIPVFSFLTTHMKMCWLPLTPVPLPAPLMCSLSPAHFIANLPL